MNTFSGTITIKWNKTINLSEYDYVENISKDWNKVVFIFGDTDFKKSEELIDDFKNKFWDLVDFDISISSEDKIEILWWDYEEWVYELASFEWEQVEFKEILDRFIDFDWVVSIREAEVSKKFWNKVIKVDFVY